VELNGVLAEVNIAGNAQYNNTVKVNTFNNNGMDVTCNSNGCTGVGIGGDGWTWSGVSHIQIQFGDGDDVAHVTDLGVVIPQTMILNGGGGSDVFTIVATNTGFQQFHNCELTFLDSLLDGSPSDGIATAYVDMCK
jgi:hypothetical protein